MNIEGVLEEISNYLNHPPPTPSVLLIDGPPLKGGEKAGEFSMGR
jgi:hypothetical protein